MYKPCTFNREDYLELEDSFEAVAIVDAQEELTEFSDDAGDLAFELAYTRYALAKAEKKIEKFEAKLRPGNKDEIKIRKPLWPDFKGNGISNLKHGQPCGHPGCCSHVSHPCEGCGRVGCQ